MRVWETKKKLILLRVHASDVCQRIKSWVYSLVQFKGSLSFSPIWQARLTAGYPDAQDVGGGGGRGDTPHLSTPLYSWDFFSIKRNRSEKIGYRMKSPGRKCKDNMPRHSFYIHPVKLYTREATLHAQHVKPLSIYMEFYCCAGVYMRENKKPLAKVLNFPFIIIYAMNYYTLRYRNYDFFFCWMFYIGKYLSSLN